MSTDRENDEEMVWETEPFDRTVRVSNEPDGGKTIVWFGNSGLILKTIKTRSEERECLFDFMPEGSVYKDEAVPARHAKMLGSSLFQLWQWLNSPPLGQEEIPSLFLKVSAVTNEDLIRAIRSIFSEYRHAELITIEEMPIGGLITIKLDGFKSLTEDDLLIRRLKFFDDQARKLQVYK